MPILTGGSFKEISPDDIKVRTTTLNQLIDVIQEDISGSLTRKAYQVFVTGADGTPGVTSSLYHTVHDQDFTLQTANPIFDITVGVNEETAAVQSIKLQQAGAKPLFPSTSMMVREKIDIYRQFASDLLGDSAKKFYSPFGSTVEAQRIDYPVFISFRRLFARDSIKRETFALRMYRSASQTFHFDHTSGSNIDVTSERGAAIFTDIGSALEQEVGFGGPVGNLVSAANTSEKVGLIFYDKGTVVLDANKVFSGSQPMSGTISAMSPALTVAPTSGALGAAGQLQAGAAPMAAGTQMFGTTVGGNFFDSGRKFIPNLWLSSSMDDLIGHICETRFSSGSLTAATFQNVTQIHSTLVFCRAGADEFNYSSNPSFTDDTGTIVVSDVANQDTARPFTFPTTIGLHDDQGRLLAVAKLSRPIEKNDEKDVTFRIRLDF